jgi:hypothetical protein
MQFLFAVKAQLSEWKQQISRGRETKSRSRTGTDVQRAYLAFTARETFSMRRSKMNFDGGFAVEIHVTLGTAERRRQLASAVSPIAFATNAGHQIASFGHLQTDGAR